MNTEGLDEFQQQLLDAAQLVTLMRRRLQDTGQADWVTPENLMQLEQALWSAYAWQLGFMYDPDGPETSA